VRGKRRILNVGFLLLLLPLLIAGTGSYRWRDSPIVRGLTSLPAIIQGRVLSALDAAHWHRRIFAAQADLLVKGMYEADQKHLDRALAKQNAAYPRAQWRLALDPRGLEVKVDGTQYHFWSDELIFNRYRTNHLHILGTAAFMKRGEFLPWELFRTIQYDQMPRPMAEFIIGLQADRFGKFLRPRQWPKMCIEDWRSVPDPIRKIAAYRMVWRWAAEYAPASMRSEEAARIIAAIGRVESLFDIDKVVNRNPRTQKADLGFLQISDGLRQSLRRLPEFKKYDEDDFLKPWVSIREGTYSLFLIFLKGAGGNVLEAISHYNAGRYGSEQRAETYLKAVIQQYRRAFVDKKYSPTLGLLLRQAEPRYFRGVRDDLLFHEQQKMGPGYNFANLPAPAA
jgi:hypothetical protein